MKTYLLLLAVMSFISVNGQQDMHITEQLLNGTIRIETSNKSGSSTGTGFFFNFYADTENKIPLPVIITNKHVVNGFDSIRLYFRKTIGDRPDYGAPYIVTIPNNSSTVIQHPNKDIDLVAIPTGVIYNELEKKGITLYCIAADESRIPDDSTQKLELKPIEDILMIGYPNGLWDEKNNMPIVRKGVTATTPYLDFNGKREFLIDIAAFGGSSGSPIIFYRDIYTDKNYVPKVGLKLYLLGILYAGPLYTLDGNVIKSDPTDKTIYPKIKTSITMNLGYVIKASELLEFKKILLRK